MDGRVIDLPPVLRAALVYGIIAPFRAHKSAKLYREIWHDKQGSPLMYYSKQQLQLLRDELGDEYQVELAMRYGQPSIANALNKLKDANRIKIIPLFPQYASATTGSVFQEVARITSQWVTIPNIEFINSFHDDPLLITAFADRGRNYLPEIYDHVIFSFHGLPQKHLLKGDVSERHCLKASDCCKTLTDQNKFCYGAQSHHTAKLITEALSIPDDKFTVSFQSRLGYSAWMQPYTIDVIKKLARSGKSRILVFCPAFVADCLETIHEIGVEYRDVFIAAGGEHLQLVSGLNASPLFIETLKRLAVG